EHLWAILVADVRADAPRSVFLADWPEPGSVDRALLADVAEVRQVVELGRQARVTSRLRVRQPLRQLVVEGAARAAGYGDEIAEELRVKKVVFGAIEATELRVRPNLPVLGPRLGAQLGSVRSALEAGEFDELPEGAFRAAG